MKALIVIAGLGLAACAPAVAHLDPATQAKLDKVIALAERSVDSPAVGPAAGPTAGPAQAPAGGQPQAVAVHVSCRETAPDTNTRVVAWIGPAAGGERLREANLACPDQADLFMPGPGDLVAAIDYEVGAPQTPSGWAIDWEVVQLQEEAGPQPLVRQTWKQGPSQPKGHAERKVVLAPGFAPRP